jgi:hypothetical protein
MTSHAVVTEAAVWLGLLHGTLVYGWHPFWAMFVLAASSTYIVLPAVGNALRPENMTLRQARGWFVTAAVMRLRRMLKDGEQLDPGGEWIARVARITTLSPELASRLPA